MRSSRRGNYGTGAQASIYRLLLPLAHQAMQMPNKPPITFALTARMSGASPPAPQTHAHTYARKHARTSARTTASYDDSTRHKHPDPPTSSLKLPPIFDPVCHRVSGARGAVMVAIHLRLPGFDFVPPVRRACLQPYQILEVRTSPAISVNVLNPEINTALPSAWL